MSLEVDENKTYEYVWDEKKRQDNIKKHHLDFARADEVFQDPYGIIVFDGNTEEERYLFIGVLDEVIVTVVVYTEQEETKVRRIISFRKATKEEREAYYGRR